MYFVSGFLGCVFSFANLFVLLLDFFRCLFE